MKKLLKWIGILLLLVVAVVVGLLHYATYRFEQGTNKHVEEVKGLHQASVTAFSKESKVPFYIRNGTCYNNVNIVMVHGTPGSFDNYLPYLENDFFKTRYCMYAYERPGFGVSKKSGAVPTLDGQLVYLNNLIDQEKLVKVWVIGHSYGCSIALDFAIANPEKCAGIVLVASPADPQYEKYIWLRKIINFPVISWILPYSMRNSNRELIKLKADTERQSQQLNEIKAPVLILHGTSDRLVPYENAMYLENQLINSKDVELKTYDDMGHFILWQESDEIMQLIDQFITRQQ